MSKDLGISTAYGYAVSRGYTGTEEEFAELMASYAHVAEDARASAETASNAKDEAVSAKNTAVTSAQTASNKASEAAQHAQYASTSANTASTKASEASASASNAQTSASTASTKATEAASSATAANSAKTDAVNAKNAAQTAQTASETARTAAEEAQASAEQAAQEAHDTLDKKAEIDGYYEEMTVGDAEQLVSSQYVEDSVPYLYRTTGGSADVGNREYMESIVGGSIAWNQLVEHGNFDSLEYWINYQASCVVADGVATVTPTTGIVSRIYRNISIVKGHKYLMTAWFKGNVGEGNAMLSWYGGINNFSPFTGSWQKESTILDNTYNSANNWQVHYGASNNPNLSAYQVKNAMLFDLTQMFGSTIADYIYSLEQANAGAGVAWFEKLFPNEYYEYDAGTLKHVEGLTSHDMTGFNQWDEEWEVGYINPQDGTESNESNKIRMKNYMPVLPNTQYYKRSPSSAFWNVYFDENKKFVGYDSGIREGVFTTPANAHYIRSGFEAAYGTTYKNDVCINLSWSGWRNGEYEPYQKHSYPLDSSLVLRGILKLDAQNNLCYDGDVYNHDGTVERRYGIVDLGTLNWNYRTGSGLGDYFFATLNGIKYAGSFTTTVYPLTCAKYIPSTRSIAFGNGRITVDGVDSTKTPTQIQIKDESYTDAASFKAAMSGVYLVYELATPTTEEAEPFQEVQICDDFGTEEFVTTSIVPVGHNTEYPANLRDKLQHLPNLADADGYYMIKQTDKQMSLEHFRIPKAPTEDGTWVLKAVVSGGTPTYSWVKEETA